MNAGQALEIAQGAKVAKQEKQRSHFFMMSIGQLQGECLFRWVFCPAWKLDKVNIL